MMSPIPLELYLIFYFYLVVLLTISCLFWLACHTWINSKEKSNNIPLANLQDPDNTLADLSSLPDDMDTTNADVEELKSSEVENEKKADIASSAAQSSSTGAESMELGSIEPDSREDASSNEPKSSTETVEPPHPGQTEEIGGTSSPEASMAPDSCSGGEVLPATEEMSSSNLGAIAEVNLPAQVRVPSSSDCAIMEDFSTSAGISSIKDEMYINYPEPAGEAGMAPEAGTAPEVAMATESCSGAAMLPATEEAVSSKSEPIAEVEPLSSSDGGIMEDFSTSIGIPSIKDEMYINYPEPAGETGSAPEPGTAPEAIMTTESSSGAAMLPATEEAVSSKSERSAEGGAEPEAEPLSSSEGAIMEDFSTSVGVPSLIDEMYINYPGSTEEAGSAQDIEIMEDFSTSAGLSPLKEEMESPLHGPSEASISPDAGILDDFSTSAGLSPIREEVSSFPLPRPESAMVPECSSGSASKSSIGDENDNPTTLSPKGVVLVDKCTLTVLSPVLEEADTGTESMSVSEVTEPSSSILSRETSSGIMSSEMSSSIVSHEMSSSSDQNWSLLTHSSGAGPAPFVRMGNINEISVSSDIPALGRRQQLSFSESSSEDNVPRPPHERRLRPRAFALKQEIEINLSGSESSSEFVKPSLSSSDTILSTDGLSANESGASVPPELPPRLPIRKETSSDEPAGSRPETAVEGEEIGTGETTNIGDSQEETADEPMTLEKEQCSTNVEETGHTPMEQSGSSPDSTTTHAAVQEPVEEGASGVSQSSADEPMTLEKERCLTNIEETEDTPMELSEDSPDPTTTHAAVQEPVEEEEAGVGQSTADTEEELGRSPMSSPEKRKRNKDDEDPSVGPSRMRRSKRIYFN